MMNDTPSMHSKPAEAGGDALIHKQRKSKNIALGLILAALCLIIYGVSIIRISESLQ